MVCTVALNLYGSCLLKIAKSMFFFVVCCICYIPRLWAWHNSGINQCLLSYTSNYELLGTRICNAGSMKPCCFKYCEQTHSIVYLRCIV